MLALYTATFPPAMFLFAHYFGLNQKNPDLLEGMRAMAAHFPDDPRFQIEEHPQFLTDFLGAYWMPLLAVWLLGGIALLILVALEEKRDIRLMLEACPEAIRELGLPTPPSAEGAS